MEEPSEGLLERSRNLEQDMAEDRHIWCLGVDGRLLAVQILIIIYIYGRGQSSLAFGGGWKTLGCIDPNNIIIFCLDIEYNGFACRLPPVLRASLTDKHCSRLCFLVPQIAIMARDEEMDTFAYKCVSNTCLYRKYKNVCCRQVPNAPLLLWLIKVLGYWNT